MDHFLLSQTIPSLHHVMKKAEIQQIGTLAVIGKRSIEITLLRRFIYL